MRVILLILAAYAFVGWNDADLAEPFSAPVEASSV